MYPGPLFYHVVHWLVSATALMVTAFVVPGFRVKSFGSALIAALVIGAGNWTIRPILMFLAFPLNLLTLGLFTFVVNAVILKLAAWILDGFDIDGWWSAIFGALIVAVVQSLLHFLII